MGIVMSGQLGINIFVCAMLLSHIFAGSDARQRSTAAAVAAERLYHVCIRKRTLAVNLARGREWLQRHAYPVRTAIPSVATLPENDCQSEQVSYRIIAYQQPATKDGWPNESVTYARK